MRAEVLGVRFDGVTVEQAADWVLDRICRGEGGYVCTPNPEIVWACRRDEALRAAVAGADLTLADGEGVVWASRVLGTPLPERAAGYDVLLAALERSRGSVFLLGGKPGVAERAGKAIRERFPAMTVAGCRDGYFTGDGPVLEAVRAAGPALALVCLGSPKQELWMAEHRDDLPGTLMIGLGGSLDVLAGDAPRAPESWRRRKLEWLYRLLREPRRLKRQLCLPLFVLAVLAERHKKRGSYEPRSV